MSEKMKKRNVTFSDQVQVKKHAITIDDNPACVYGIPIGIDWEVVKDGNASTEIGTYSLQRLEAVQDRRYREALEQRKGRRAAREYAPRGPPIRRLSYYDRIKLLHRAGFSDQEIFEKEKQVRKARSQRNNTITLTFPRRFIEVIRGKFRKLTTGKGTKRDKRRVVKNWYKFYQNSDSGDKTSFEKSTATV